MTVTAPSPVIVAGETRRCEHVHRRRNWIHRHRPCRHQLPCPGRRRRHHRKSQDRRHHRHRRHRWRRRYRPPRPYPDRPRHRRYRRLPRCPWRHRPLRSASSNRDFTCPSTHSPAISMVALTPSVKRATSQRNACDHLTTACSRGSSWGKIEWYQCFASSFGKHLAPAKNARRSQGGKPVTSCLRPLNQ